LYKAVLGKSKADAISGHIIFHSVFLRLHWFLMGFCEGIYMVHGQEMIEGEVFEPAKRAKSSHETAFISAKHNCIISDAISVT